MFKCDFLLQPLSSAERKKRYTEKLKETGKFEEYKQKNAVDAKKRRDRIKVGVDALPKRIREKTKRLEREYNRKRVAKCRQQKKEANGVLVETTNHLPLVKHKTQPDRPYGYKTSSARQKAATKIRRSLPSTSEKTIEALGQLLKSFDPNDVKRMIDGKAEEPKRTKGVTQPEIDLVRAFYERDDISRMSPNVKDCRKFTDPVTGVQEHKQLRFLMYKLTDVFAMFGKHVESGKSYYRKNFLVKLFRFRSRITYFLRFFTNFQRKYSTITLQVTIRKISLCNFQSSVNFVPVM